MKRQGKRKWAGFGVTVLALGVSGVHAQEPGISPPQWAQAQAAEETPQLDVPYVPTPQSVVDGMLDAAGVRPGDRLYDLGSGDGRIVITAAKRYGIRGTGVDRNPERIREANANAREAGVQHLVNFEEGDLFETELSDATVVTLYLLPDVNEKLKPKLLSELRPGTRVVSHAFDMGEWKPDRTLDVDGRTIYVWTIPERDKVARPGR